MPSYVLDTNILSEFYRPAPNRKVIDWLKRQNPENLYITAFNLAELRYGIEKLPEGKKRAGVETWLNTLLLPNFKGRILVFDSQAAHVWAAITAHDKTHGRLRPYMEAFLASIALAKGMTFVTRNAKDFSGLGIELVNPFGDRG